MKISILAVATTIITIGGAVVAFDNVRFWPWRTDFERVAFVSYLARIHQLEDKVIQLRLATVQCSENPDCSAEMHRELLRDLRFYQETIEGYTKEHEEVTD